MAGDWIKIRVDIHDDPAVIDMAARLQKHENEVVGALVRFWSWVSRMSANGHIQLLTPCWLDRHLGIQGMADELQAVGWLEVTDEGLHIPNFERHMSESAKRRALNAEYQRKTRGKDVSKTSAVGADKVLTRKEKRREEMRRGKPRSDKPPPEYDPQPAMEFFQELGVRGTQLPDALKACRRHQYTSEDLEDWRELWRQATERTKIDDTRERLKHAPSFVRSEMLAAKNPRDRGIAWYKPRAKENTARQKAVAACQRLAGKEVELDGTRWTVEPQGLRGPDGMRPWGSVGTTELEQLRSARARGEA